MAIRKDPPGVTSRIALGVVGLMTLMAVGCSIRPLDESLPADLGFAEESGARLLWINSTADCLNCQNLDYRLRKIQARWGAAVELTLVHVGSSDEKSIAEGFLRKHRLDAEVVSIQGGTIRSYEPAVITPALVLLVDGEVAWTSMESASLTHPIDDLERVIASTTGQASPNQSASADTLEYGKELFLWVPKRSSDPMHAIVGRVDGCLRLLTRDPSVSQRSWGVVDPELVERISLGAPYDSQGSTTPPDTPAYEDVAWLSTRVRDSMVSRLNDCSLT